MAGEAPDDDRRGEALDRRVETEADQGHGAGHDPGEDRYRALGRHVREAEPGEPPDPRRQPKALGVAQRRTDTGRGWSRADPRRQDRLEERSPRVGQRVHHHLPVPARCHQPGGAKRPRVVGDQLVRALGDPGEIADAEFLTIADGRRHSEACRVTEGLGPLGRGLQLVRRPGVGPSTASAFGRSRQSRSHESSEADIRLILTSVRMCVTGRAVRAGSGRYRRGVLRSESRR